MLVFKYIIMCIKLSDCYYLLLKQFYVIKSLFLESFVDFFLF